MAMTASVAYEKTLPFQSRYPKDKILLHTIERETASRFREFQTLLEDILSISPFLLELMMYLLKT
jgi:antitoxin component of RelBE/YafQ-DinJ toxin-antitoxin module